MILNKRWYEGTYDPFVAEGTGRRFFLGGAAIASNSPVVVTGGVKTDGGWVLFAQSVVLYADEESCLRSVEEYVDLDDEADDPIMGVILSDAPGWEWDVVGEALLGASGYFVLTVREMTEQDAKEALQQWVKTLDLHTSPSSDCRNW